MVWSGERGNEEQYAALGRGRWGNMARTWEAFGSLPAAARPGWVATRAGGPPVYLIVPFCTLPHRKSLWHLPPTSPHASLS